jgi:NADH-quinone oxidoreductase subunit C
VRAEIEERYGARAEVSEAFGEITVDVGAGDWIDLLTFARDSLGCVFFDWLTGVDDPPDGFSVVTHVFDPVQHAHLMVRTRVPRDDPRMPSATGVYRGADWHERETFEMFGVIFEGHPHLVPLLLPDGFEGHPLRKDFILASRVARPWPGAKEPGESGQGSPSRRKTLPPGVPADWGPSATTPPPTRGPRAVRGPDPQARPGEAPAQPVDPPQPAQPAPPTRPEEEGGDG